MKTFEISQIEIHNSTEEEIRRRATEAGFRCATRVYKHPDRDSMVYVDDNKGDQSPDL